MSTGSVLTTKGLAGGSVTVTPPVTPTASLPPPPSEPARLEASPPHGSVIIVVPTAINVVLLAAENIVDNIKSRNAASLTLPSLYKRAYLIANETDEIALAKEL